LRVKFQVHCEVLMTDDLNIGMFLYANVVLKSMEFMDNIAEIENELRVLPENLDAA
jgi:hypothetical protein